MDLIPKDKMSRIGLVLGCSLLSVIILKSLEKNLSKNISNILIVFVILGSVYLSVEINNEQENFYYQDEDQDQDEDEEETITTVSSVDEDNDDIDNMINAAYNADITTANNAAVTAANNAAVTAANNAAITAANNAATAVNAANNATAAVTVANNAAVTAANNAAAAVNTDNNAMLNNGLSSQAPSTNLANTLNVQAASEIRDEFSPVQQSNNKKVPVDCYPQNILDAKDLLPHDKDSEWAKNSPNTKGALGDKNLLNAGFHIGVNTVGQSLRNANRQIRSEPPNPQVKVSPWLQSTIEPDINRKPLEIGCGEL